MLVQSRREILYLLAQSSREMIVYAGTEQQGDDKMLKNVHRIMFTR
jgi:hypothetical protein